MNQQPAEKRVRAETLSVHSIFYTIQGEGPFCGTPAVFIRLAGCNLQCPACDTDYTSNRSTMTVDEVMMVVRGKKAGTDEDRFKRRLVVITGGEPFRQDLNDLIRTLIEEEYYVQVETNGTLEPPICASAFFSVDPQWRQGLYIVVSPKAGKVHPRVAELACSYKYVMNCYNIDPDDGLPTRALDHPAFPRLARPPENWNRAIYLQPMDQPSRPIMNSKHLNACVQSCMKYGYTLQLQVHKIIGME